MKKLAVVVFLLTLPFGASAEQRKQGTGPNIYTECGIGGMLFSQSTTSSNVGAVTSNVIWDVGLTATTSGLSSPHLCVDKKQQVAKLILETLPDLEKDIAAGEGKYLTALSSSTGCKDGVMNEGLRASYAEIVSQDGYSMQSKLDKASGMFNAVDKVAAANGCAI